MKKAKELPVRIWIVQQTIEQGWSRDTLIAIIKDSYLFEYAGKVNFLFGHFR